MIKTAKSRILAATGAGLGATRNWRRLTPRSRALREGIKAGNVRVESYWRCWRKRPVSPVSRLHHRSNAPNVASMSAADRKRAIAKDGVGEDLESSRRA